MKRIFFILSVFFIGFTTLPAKAAHIIGGDFTVEWISGNDFKPELKLFRDCFGSGADFDQTIQITIYDSDTDSIWGFFTMTDPEITPIILGDDCYTPTSLCVQQGVYDTIVNLPDNPGGYYLPWESHSINWPQGGCRSPAMIRRNFYMPIWPAYRPPSTTCDRIFPGSSIW